jgi:hypothetical protein
VFYWDDVNTTDAGSVWYAWVSSDRRLLNVMIEGEFSLTTVNRSVYLAQPNVAFNAESKLLGAQTGAGPRLKVGPFATYLLGGLNWVKVTEETDSISPGSSTTRWVGVSGVSQYWAAVFNQMGSSGFSGTFTFPSYSRFSPSATLGASVDLGRVRLSVEQVRVFADPARTDRRIGVGVTY